MEPNQDLLDIEKVRSGDIQAFRYLVDRYKDMAYTVALKLMKDEDEAEEITQESFIKAFQQLPSFKGEAKFSTWLYTIVYRTAIYQLRKRKRVFTGIEQVDRSADTAKGPSEQLEASQERAMIKKAIDRLPKLEALIVTFYYLHEKSVEEICDITALSKSNVKVKLFRARKKLKKELDFLVN